MRHPVCRAHLTLGTQHVSPVFGKLPFPAGQTLSTQVAASLHKYFHQVFVTTLTTYYTSSLHSLLPPSSPKGTSIYHLITSPLKISSHPNRTKNTNPFSHMFSPTIRLHCFYQCIYCFFCLFSIILFSLWLLLSINDI